MLVIDYYLMSDKLKYPFIDTSDYILNSILLNTTYLKRQLQLLYPTKHKNVSCCGWVSCFSVGLIKFALLLLPVRESETNKVSTVYPLFVAFYFNFPALLAEQISGTLAHSMWYSKVTDLVLLNTSLLIYIL